MKNFHLFRILMLACILLTCGYGPAGYAQARVNTQNAGDIAKPVAAAAILESFYVGEDGGAYFVSCLGDDVYWYAEHPGKKYAHVFKGKYDKKAKTVSGSWWDVAKYSDSGSGTVTFNVETGGLWKIAKKTGDFPTIQLRRNDLTKKIIDQLPGQKPGGFSANKMSDLDGSWRSEKNVVCYARQIGNDVAMFCESKSSKGSLPAEAAVFVGKRTRMMSQGDLVYVSKGKRKPEKFTSAFRVTADNQFEYLSGQNFGGKTWKRFFPDYSADINSYVKSLNYDPLKVLNAQSNSSQKETGRVKGSPQDNLICDKVSYDLKNNLKDVIIFEPNNEVIWPGAIVKVNKNLGGGVPQLVTAIPRDPVTVSIDLPGFTGGKGVFKIDPVASKVKSAMNDQLKWWNDHAFKSDYVNPSKSFYKESISYSKEQTAIELGVNIGMVSASFSHKSTSENKVVYIMFKQVFYTASIDQPATPADWFSEQATLKQVKDNFTASTPLAYISSVQYGRIILVEMNTSSNYSETDIKAAVNYMGSGGNVSTSVSDMMKESSFTFVTIGGNAGTSLQNVDAAKIRETVRTIIKEGATYQKKNPGVPIAYTVKFIKDNSVAIMGQTTSFQATECRPYEEKTIKLLQGGVYYASFRVTWQEGSASKEYYSGLKSKNWRYTVRFPDNAKNIRILIKYHDGSGRNVIADEYVKLGYQYATRGYTWNARVSITKEEEKKKTGS